MKPRIYMHHGYFVCESPGAYGTGINVDMAFGDWVMKLILARRGS